MKNIKSITLVVFCMCIAAFVQAQAEIKKPAASSKPQVGLPPVLAPEMKNAPKPVANAEPVTEAPSPLTRDKNQQLAEAEKPDFKLLEYKEPETPGGAEGKKIMAGKTTRSAPEINNHSTIDNKPAPQPAIPAKPTKATQQQ